MDSQKSYILELNKGNILGHLTFPNLWQLIVADPNAPSPQNSFAGGKGIQVLALMRLGPSIPIRPHASARTL